MQGQRVSHSPVYCNTGDCPGHLSVGVYIYIYSIIIARYARCMLGDCHVASYLAVFATKYRHYCLVFRPVQTYVRLVQGVVFVEYRYIYMFVIVSSSAVLI